MYRHLCAYKVQFDEVLYIVGIMNFYKIYVIFDAKLHSVLPYGNKDGMMMMTAADSLSFKANTFILAGSQNNLKVHTNNTNNQRFKKIN